MATNREEASSNDKKFSLKSLGKKELILLFLAGLLLVFATVPDLFSKKDDNAQEEKVTNNTSANYISTSESSEEEEYIAALENKLKKLLEKMEGVGKAEVMITLKSSKEQVVLKDAPYTQESLNETDHEGGTRISSSTQNQEETVLVTGSTGGSVPYVTKEMEAVVEGVVVLAQGGGDGNIASKIVTAVGVLFDVPAHKVQVLKMEE